MKNPPTHRNDADLQITIFSHDRRLRGELSFDRYTKSGYCHEGLLSRANQAAENGEDIGRGIEQ